jgi:hypothetical protein
MVRNSDLAESLYYSSPKMNSNEIKSYIETIQYKINANKTAVRIAFSAASDANKAYIKAYKTIVAIQNANIITEKAINSAKIATIEAEQSYIRAAISEYKYLLNFLYSETISINKKIKPSSLILANYSLRDLPLTDRSNKRELCIKMKKRHKIYDINHKKKKRRNIVKMIQQNVKKLNCFSGDGEYGSDSENENKSESECESE